ncbi:MAG: hypothetical protein GX660_25590 [Clostridiaceae bacterium]|nr:hypothetical protein [Clostridiaceae bacterium]
MNNLNSYFKKACPTILSVLGAVGVITTTVLAVKATPKAIRLLKNAEAEKLSQLGEERENTAETLTKKEIFLTTWKCYIPTTLVGLSTIACIFGANLMSKKNQAALISAYAMLNESYKNYKNGAKKVFGEDADSKIKIEMAKDAYVSAEEIYLYSLDTDPAEKILCYDLLSKRYFNTTMGAVLNAEYHVNRNLNIRGFVSVNEFYEFLGIESVENGDNIGWSYFENLDGFMWLDFENTFNIMDDGMECCIISTLVGPDTII